MNVQRVFLFIILAFALTASAIRAEENKIVVCVEHTGGDSVGQRLVFAVREAIRASHGYKLGTKVEAALSITLVTLDPDANRPRLAGKSTIASVVFTMTNIGPYQKNNPQSWYPIYLTSLVVTVGEGRVDEFGKSILADLDEAYMTYKKAK